MIDNSNLPTSEILNCVSDQANSYTKDSLVLEMMKQPLHGVLPILIYTILKMEWERFPKYIKHIKNKR